MREIGQGFLRIVTNWRLLILILIITGFTLAIHPGLAVSPAIRITYFGIVA